MIRPIRSLLIANRGEIALRVIRTCRDLGIRSIAVFSDADSFAPHVRSADDSVHIGPAQSSLSYLNIDAILEAARTTGADAIHPGYGFLSENHEFAEAVTRAGMIFVGPPASAMAMMGDKTRARQAMKKAGVPIVPGSDGPLHAIDEAAAFVHEHGLPVLLKAAAGGGGKGMRLVRTAEDLPSAFQSAASEAKSAFGDERVYIERYLDAPRHIEIQVLADQHGSVVHLGERECSIQRRHQKIIEESPSPILTPGDREEMAQTAVRAAKTCGYVNAGTIEFLRDAEGKFYFLEMNTRLQVEHPITELRTGLDLVALQIRIAEGGTLPFRQEEVRWNGHAIECRICAEDVENDYMPSTGRLLHLRPAAGPGIREDRGVEEGSVIPVYYDSMLAKLCAWAPDRTEAIHLMARALHEYEVLGVRTNIPLLQFVLNHPEFVKGDFSTHFLEKVFTPSRLNKGTEGFREAAAIACALLEHGLTSNGQARRRETRVNAKAWKSLRFEL